MPDDQKFKEFDINVMIYNSNKDRRNNHDRKLIRFDIVFEFDNLDRTDYIGSDRPIKNQFFKFNDNFTDNLSSRISNRSRNEWHFNTLGLHSFDSYEVTYENADWGSNFNAGALVNLKFETRLSGRTKKKANLRFLFIHLEYKQGNQYFYRYNSNSNTIMVFNSRILENGAFRRGDGDNSGSSDNYDLTDLILNQGNYLNFIYKRQETLDKLRHLDLIKRHQWTLDEFDLQELLYVQNPKLRPKKCPVPAAPAISRNKKKTKIWADLKRRD